MKEFKGTKGNWTVNNKIHTNEYGIKFLTIDHENADDCVDIYADSRLEDEESINKMKADAKLIAAAPDLLEALQFCQNVLFKNGILDVSDRMAVDKAEEAINKALGD